MNNENVYEKITNAIIEQLEQGQVPWRKPWVGGAMGCISHTNGRPYSVLNQWLLGNRVGEWLTFNQVKAEGGSIKNGEKASFVVFWKFIPKTEKDDEGNDVVVSQIPILKYYNVWHIDQCDGITPKFDKKDVKFEHEPIDTADEYANAYLNRESIKLFVERSDRAFYRPSTDEIHVPMMEQFESKEEYYSTLFHESIHSTGAVNRLNRVGIAKFGHFGDENYSYEELVAEIGSAFLCNTIGIDCEKAFKNSVAYIQGWAKQLKSDKRMVVSAASKAEQAVRYFLTGEKPTKVESAGE